MAVKGADLEAELIDAVCERVRERLPADQVRAVRAFVRQYYRWVPAEDLAGREPARPVRRGRRALAISRSSASPATAKIRVYNPDFEQHGWQSPHTVDRDRHRRHAVRRRLGDDGARAGWASASTW